MNKKENSILKLAWKLIHFFFVKLWNFTLECTAEKETRLIENNGTEQQISSRPGDVILMKTMSTHLSKPFWTRWNLLLLFGTAFLNLFFRYSEVSDNSRTKCSLDNVTIVILLKKQYFSRSLQNWESKKSIFKVFFIFVALVKLITNGGGGGGLRATNTCIALRNFSNHAFLQGGYFFWSFLWHFSM
jgi:hypothetical protein